MLKFDDDRLGLVIDRFYEAATRPELWRPALHEISAICGADGALLIAQPADLGVIWSEGMDEAAEMMIRTGWHLRNERMQRYAGVVQTGRQIFTESDVFTREELDRHPFNAELVNPTGFRWYAGLPVAQVGDGMVGLSIERRSKRQPFSKTELAKMTMLGLHLRRAGSIALKFGLARSEGTLDAFEQLNCGALLLDLNGKLVRLNDSAKAQIGDCINVIEGSLHAAHKGADGALQRLIGSVVARGPAHQASAEGAAALPRPEGRPMIAYAAPIVASAGDIFQHAKAIVMLVDPDQHREPGELILHEAFGLTAAETRLALRLNKGEDLHAAAVELGISYETARTALKHVFSKVGVSRQSELTVLLAKLVLR